MTTLNFEIIDINGNDLSCQCTEADAVVTILALLGFQGDELMLDTDDWREYDWHTGKDTYSAREIVENDLDSMGSEVHFESYTDISNRVASGQWLVRDDHAYCIAHWPSGKARKLCKRRGDFTQARKLHPVWMDKLKQLESLGSQLSKVVGEPDGRMAGRATHAPTQSAASLTRDELGAGPDSGDAFSDASPLTRPESTHARNWVGAGSENISQG